MFLIVAILRLKAHSVVIHVIQTGPVLVPCAAHGQTRTGHKIAKASLRISWEALRIALGEIQREASAYALPLQGIVTGEISQVSQDDRFAALLDCWGWSLAVSG